MSRQAGSACTPPQFAHMARRLAGIQVDRPGHARGYGLAAEHRCSLGSWSEGGQMSILLLFLNKHVLLS